MSQPKRVAYSVALALFACMFALAAPTIAQSTSGYVQGFVLPGVTIPGTIAPVLMGGTDGTFARALAVDATGFMSVKGGVADGSAAPNGLVVAGKDQAGNSRTLAVTTDGGTDPNRYALVGGTDPTTGVARPLTSMRETVTVGSANFIPVGGVDGAGAIRRFPCAVPGSTSSSTVLETGGTDPAGLARKTALTPQGYAVPGDTAYASYTATAALAITAAANPTDLMAIGGSATKTVKVRSLTVWAHRTAGTITQFTTIVRSTANTGGTPTTVTAIPFDQNMAAATATCVVYTVNPTLGNTVGTGDFVSTNVATTTGTVVFSVNPSNLAPTILRGTAQQLCVNMAGIAAAGFTVDGVRVFWTEE